VRESPASTLTRERVVEVAAQLVEERGIDALSMRALADRCGVATMTLYRHVATKDELLALLADRMFEAIDLPVPGEQGWEADVRAVMGATRAVLLANPELATIVARRHVNVTAAYRGAEVVLRALREAGLDADAAVSGFAALTTFTVGFVQQEVSIPERSAQLANRWVAVQELPADEFPNVRESADAFLHRDTRRHFEMGLDLMIRGIAAVGA
jgi:AcrR family transcriptional regulator